MFQGALQGRFRDKEVLWVSGGSRMFQVGVSRSYRTSQKDFRCVSEVFRGVQDVSGKGHFNALRGVSRSYRTFQGLFCAFRGLGCFRWTFTERFSVFTEAFESISRMFQVSL